MIRTDKTVNDSALSNDGMYSTIADLLKSFNTSDDKLRNPNALFQYLVYMSAVLSAAVPVVCFAIFVYPTMQTYAEYKLQTSSIPILKQQVAQLKNEYRNRRAALSNIAANGLSVSSYHAPDAQYNPTDLHQLAHDHRLTIVAMDTLSNLDTPPEFAEHFTVSRFSWHLKGYFFNYLAFKKALRSKQPLIQPEREHLRPGDNRQLDIVVDLNVYHPKKIAL